MADEHPLFSQHCFPVVRYTVSPTVNESRWIRGTSNGAVYVATDPDGDPLEVTGELTIETAPILPPDDPALGINTFLTNEASTKVLYRSGAGNLLWADGCNPDDAANAWVQFFDAASTAAVTLGTTPPIFQMALPLGGGSSTTSGIRSESLIPLSIGFTLGLVIAVTTTRSGSTTVASPVPVQVLVNV